MAMLRYPELSHLTVDSNSILLYLLPIDLEGQAVNS